METYSNHLDIDENSCESKRLETKFGEHRLTVCLCAGDRPTYTTYMPSLHVVKIGLNTHLVFQSFIR